jgi:hypothetical protein
MLPIDRMACPPSARADGERERNQRGPRRIVGEPDGKWQVVKLRPIQPVRERDNRIPAPRDRYLESGCQEVKQGCAGNYSADHPAPEVCVSQARKERTGLAPDDIQRQGNPAEDHHGQNLQPEVRPHPGASLVCLPACSLGCSTGRHRNSYPSYFSAAGGAVVKCRASCAHVLVIRSSMLLRNSMPRCAVPQSIASSCSGDKAPAVSAIRYMPV